MSTLNLFRKKNTDYRGREYLTYEEVKRLIFVAELRGRHPVRDQALILLMFRHGLRASEATGLRWDAIALNEGQITINRLKNSNSGVHPLQPDEVEILRELHRDAQGSPFVFVSERGQPLSRDAIAKVLTACADLAELDIKIHPHMLRHACGFYLANQGYDTRLIQEWLGHRNINHTVIYTQLNPTRFKTIQW